MKRACRVSVALCAVATLFGCGQDGDAPDAGANPAFNSDETADEVPADQVDCMMRLARLSNDQLVQTAFEAPDELQPDELSDEQAMRMAVFLQTVARECLP